MVGGTHCISGLSQNISLADWEGAKGIVVAHFKPQTRGEFDARYRWNQFQQAKYTQSEVEAMYVRLRQQGSGSPHAGMLHRLMPLCERPGSTFAAQLSACGYRDLCHVNCAKAKRALGCAEDASTPASLGVARQHGGAPAGLANFTSTASLHLPSAAGRELLGATSLASRADPRQPTSMPVANQSARPAPAVPHVQKSVVVKGPNATRVAGALAPLLSPLGSCEQLLPSKTQKHQPKSYTCTFALPAPSADRCMSTRSCGGEETTLLITTDPAATADVCSTPCNQQLLVDPRWPSDVLASFAAIWLGVHRRRWWTDLQIERRRKCGL